MSQVADNLKTVTGHSLRLRLVTPEDADYIHTLRTNPAYNTHLSTVQGTAEDQRKWIEEYKERESAGLEYYYIIERLDVVRCGVVRLYNISDDSFSWGSWILDDNKPAKAALESALLSFGIGFDCLGLEVAYFDVRRENHHAIAFYRRLGVVEIRADSENLYFEYQQVNYSRDKDDLGPMINPQLQIQLST